MVRTLGILLTVGAATWAAESASYPYRWVYVSRGLGEDRHVTEIRGIAQTAAAHGLNGLVLSAGLDNLDRPRADAYLGRLRQVKAVCDEAKVELIPILFSAGYGGGVLAHDRNLAEGLPVTDARFVAKGQEAVLVPDPAAAIANGGLEEYDGPRARGYRFHDQPGEISFADTAVFHGGAASLRFEEFSKNPHGHGRLMQEVALAPHRFYRLSLWVKSDGLQPEGCFRVQVYAATDKGEALAPFEPRLPATSDWRPVVIGFNSGRYDKIRLYFGVWGAKAGRFWLDDLQLAEVGPLNVLRRPGTPVSVRGEADGTVYEEGRDFARLEDPRLSFRVDHEAPPLRLLAGGRIREGEALRVSWYHGQAINDGQVSICMSEPAVYEIWRTQSRLLHEILAPRTFLLSMDEIRAGGTCQACQARGLGLAEILGDCITRQVALLREFNPGATVAVWSDMLDPNHNAHAGYYLCEGDYTGSWDHVPKDLVIACWYGSKCKESLAHFSGLGFRTLAGAYYDADTLDNPRQWLEALRGTPGACGIMYTTWQDKYALLAPFGDLVSGRPAAR